MTTFNDYLDMHPKQRNIPVGWAKSNYRKYMTKIEEIDRRRMIEESHRSNNPNVRWVGKSDNGKPFHIYRLFNSSDELVYIGFSSNPRSRYKSHCREAVKNFEYMTVFASYDSKAAALLAEHVQIVKYDPKYNRSYHCAVKVLKWEPYELGEDCE